jgi:hypothetical protein
MRGFEAFKQLTLPAAAAIQMFLADPASAARHPADTYVPSMDEAAHDEIEKAESKKARETLELYMIASQAFRNELVAAKERVQHLVSGLSKDRKHADKDRGDLLSEILLQQDKRTRKADGERRDALIGQAQSILENAQKLRDDLKGRTWYDRIRNDPDFQRLTHATAIKILSFLRIPPHENSARHTKAEAEAAILRMMLLVEQVNEHNNRTRPSEETESE